ncbi:MAG: hypothetical protein RLZZ324_761, partial [Candidatus Parcubacteria bacterium]
CLRKKNLTPENCIVVQCLPTMESGDDVWRTALEKMGVLEVRQVSKKQGNENEIAAEGGLQLGFLSAKGTGTLKESFDDDIVREPVTSDDHLARLAKELREKNKRLVLEDFHYLPESSRFAVAFGLKALYEENAYAIVVGVWSEQNLITFYNGDLTGRIEEVNLTWEENELNQVLSQGEGALNIEFAPGLRQQLVESSFFNVGLLQRLAGKVCIDAEIFESQDSKIIISDIELLKSARKQIVNDIRQRYTRIAGVFKDGMREGAELHLYGRIYNELIEAPETELISGVPLPSLLERIQRNSTQMIRQSDLTQSLERIEKLQARRSITPLLVSYSTSLRQLFLNDREFLFYRKYSGDDLTDLKVSFETKSGEQGSLT